MKYKHLPIIVLLFASLAFYGCDDDDDSENGYDAGSGGMAGEGGSGGAGEGGSGGSAEGGSGGSAEGGSGGSAEGGSGGTAEGGSGGTAEGGSGGTGGTTEPPEPMDIIDTALDAGSFETLAAALTAADLVDTLKSDGPFTVFAPTDDAFAALGTAVDDLLLPENKDTLIKVLTYHVIAADSAIMSIDLQDGALVSTVAGPSIAVDLSGTAPMINDAEVVTADIEATNGVIHVIDKVLMPPEDIVAIAAGNEDFENLVTAVTAAELVETLQGEGPFTVFAPNDAAFDALGDTLTDLLLPENKDTLAGILTYHVVSGLVGPLDLADGALVETVNGASVAISIEGDSVMVNDAEIIATNVVADNGVIHVLDSVILPPEDIVAIASGNDDFENLVAAVTAAELVETLQGEGPFTVFAPNDAAFDALGDTLTDLLLPENKDTLAGILTYHVVSGLVGPLDLVDGALVETVNGAPVSISVADGIAKINEAAIMATNVVADNGVIHVLDAVILPPTDDIVATAINTEDEFTQLEAALGAADLVSALQGEGPFTVFAPTDAAFDALGDTLTDLLLPENKEQLTDILLYHVVSGSVGAADLTDGATVETLLEGSSVTFDLSGETPMVDDANIVLTNIITTNGIIHVIDKVIIPES